MLLLLMYYGMLIVGIFYLELILYIIIFGGIFYGVSYVVVESV